jgi:hypothetical protein
MRMIALLSAAAVLAPAAAFSQPGPPATPTGSVLDDWKIERQEDGVVLTPRDVGLGQLFIVAMQPDLDARGIPLRDWFDAKVSTRMAMLGRQVEDSGVRESSGGGLATVRGFEVAEGRRLNASFVAARQPDGKLLMVTILCTSDECLRHMGGAEKMTRLVISSGALVAADASSPFQL